ncbi:MAG: ABC transporter permease subunit [Nitrospiraceae bacterium]|nr:MAG: ABC transporter permease subunit [Nitrospiraceae bacterium]
MGAFNMLANWDFYLMGAFPRGEPGGLLLNLIFAVLALSLSFSVGVLFGYSRLSSRLYVKIPCIAYVEIVRATPLLIIIFWFYYVIPTLFGIHISVFWTVVLSLCFYAAAYQAEIVRAGITAVPRGQLETALASGMSRYESMGYVILPQAFRMMVPSFISFFISLFKDTSTVFIIGVIELTQAGFIVSYREPDQMIAAYASIAAGFFLVCSGLSFVAGKLEKRIGIYDFQSYRPDVSRDEFMLFPKYKFLRRPSSWTSERKKKGINYAMVINLSKCTGCHACQVTCKAEHDVPFGAFRCFVETVQSGHYPDVKKFFLPRLCNHCDKPPCIEACEEQDAIFKTPDGTVLINRSKCPTHVECRKCYEYCPYHAIDINPRTGGPEKCDFCYDRLKRGEEPVCVMSCMGKAMIFGDMNDRDSEIAKLLSRRQIKVLNPEHGSFPRVFYLAPEDHGMHAPLKNYEIPRGRSVSRFPVKEAARESDGTTPAPPVQKYVYTADSMCPSECGLSVLVEDGIAKKIYGNPHSCVSSGAVCAKGASGLQLTYSPHRVRTPLIRTGERGEDLWRPVTWEEAADYVTKKLIGIKKKHGPEAVIYNGGDMSDGIAYERLFRAFGTPNILHHGSICDPNRRWGHRLMTGDSRPLPDVQRPLLTRNEQGELTYRDRQDAKLIVNVGVNPFVATRFNYMSGGITAARTDNNCKYIVIDPAHTNSAALADMWLHIIPGTDAALLAAMLHYIIENYCQDYPSQCYIDKEFIDNYTIGWQEFRDAFMAQAKRKDPSNSLSYFSPEWAEEKTGIPRGDIKKISHLFGITKPASIEVGMHGTAHHTNGDVTSILATALCLITGNVDRPGGLVLMGPHKPKKGARTAGLEFLNRTVTRDIFGTDVSGSLSMMDKDACGDYPASPAGVLANLPEKIRNGITLKHGPFRDYTYPVKALVTRAGNPVITAGSRQDWVDALTARDEKGAYLVELNVHIDTHITVSGTYADVVFPEAGFLERMGLSSVYTMSPEIALRDKVIKPLHESKTSFEFMVFMADAFIRNGDPDIRAEDFGQKYARERDFINEQLLDTPGFYNIGTPLPYPDLPEGCLIIGAPDNPRAVWGDTVISTGELLTVDWLRKHNGVAIWPASYYRYRKSDGTPSGKCPATPSGKFEFTFGYLEKINKRFGTSFPTTFYWADCNWNPKNPRYRQLSRQYPFQLISGRVHHSMTMTVICSYLSETETECMAPLNNDFEYAMPPLSATPNHSGLPETGNSLLRAGTVSIPVFALNRSDGEAMRIRTGDLIILENPLKRRIAGKALLTEEIMPGVIKVPFGPGGQRASGLGFINATCGYTPNVNELHDPQNINAFTGTPGFGDIMVRVIKPDGL